MNALTPSPIPPKIGPLVRRLATDQDGERLACLAAIQRQLDRVGLTWHDVADRLASAPEAARHAPSRPTFTDYAEAVDWCLERDDGVLTARQRDFLRSMTAILDDYEPTAAQVKWLGALVRKLGGRLNG